MANEIIPAMLLQTSKLTIRAMETLDVYGPTLCRQDGVRCMEMMTRVCRVVKDGAIRVEGTWEVMA